MNYKKQRNLLVKINHECKREHFNELNVEIVTKPFWKICEPYFTNKHLHDSSEITLIGNNKIVLQNHKIAKTFNTYFVSVTVSPNPFEWIVESVNSNNKIEQIIVKFPKHPSILKIKQKVKTNRKLPFQSVSEDAVNNVVKNLPSNKAAAGEIPSEILENSDFCSIELRKCINKPVKQNKFPDSLKFSDLVPVCKKSLIQTIRQTLEQLIFHFYSPKCLKMLYMIKVMNMWINF